MLEPRKFKSWLWARPNMRFIGGTTGFDLWYRHDKDVDASRAWTLESNTSPCLRVVRIGAGVGIDDWDDFRLPLHLNEEVGSIGHPAERRLKGRWGDIHLTLAQVNEVETYLRCFAPWVLGEALTGDNKETSDV